MPDNSRLLFSQRRKERKERKEKRLLLTAETQRARSYFIVFVGATLVANNPSDSDEFAAEAAPTDQDQFIKTRFYLRALCVSAIKTIN